jgi:hypothetical protein
MYSNTPRDLITYWGGTSQIVVGDYGETPYKKKTIFFMSTTRKRMQDVGSVELRLP